MASARYSVSSIRVEGLRNLVKTAEESGLETEAWLRAELWMLGEKVAVDVRRAYRPYSAKGADAIKAKVTRPGNVVVAQTLRKGRNVRRSRPNFGGLMMRKAFLPALDKHQADTDAGMAALSVRLEEKWL